MTDAEIDTITDKWLSTINVEHDFGGSNWSFVPPGGICFGSHASASVRVTIHPCVFPVDDFFPSYDTIILFGDSVSGCVDSLRKEIKRLLVAIPNY